MSHCDICQALSHIAIMPKMWHINNVSLDVYKISSCIINYGHVVHQSQPWLSMAKMMYFSVMLRHLLLKSEKNTCLYTNNVSILSYEHFILHDKNLMKQLHFNVMIGAKWKCQMDLFF